MSHSSESVNELLGHLFRQEAGRMASVLARIFGLEKIDHIEDAIQDAMIAAMRKWPFGGIPENPSAWLIQVAKNKLLDQLRRDKKHVSTEEEAELSAEIDTPQFASEFSEDLLRMMFACCHPAIPADSQVALTLKIVGGFSVSEIARAFLAKDEAIAKMLTRAKAKLKDSRIKLEMPLPAEIPKRSDAVMHVLYLMFNEGYNATDGEQLIKNDLCNEAIRLCRIFAIHPVTDSPKAHALAALMLFQGARLPARYDSLFGLRTLSVQDRSLWNKAMIGEGLNHMRLSAQGDELTDYHLEAEIASRHSLSPDFESTDWPRLLECYDELLRRKPSPVVALNRIVALSKVSGNEVALAEMQKLSDDKKLQTYAPYFYTLANLQAEAGLAEDALESYRKAADLTNNEPTLSFIKHKIKELSFPINSQ